MESEHDQRGGSDETWDDLKGVEASESIDTAFADSIILLPRPQKRSISHAFD